MQLSSASASRRSTRDVLSFESRYADSDTTVSMSGTLGKSSSHRVCALRRYEVFENASSISRSRPKFVDDVRSRPRLELYQRFGRRRVRFPLAGTLDRAERKFDVSRRWARLMLVCSNASQASTPYRRMQHALRGCPSAPSAKLRLAEASGGRAVIFTRRLGRS